MSVEGAEFSGEWDAKAKAHKFLGSLKDALLAAGRDEHAAASPPPLAQVAPPAAVATSEAASPRPALGPSAEEAARMARTVPAAGANPKVAPRAPESVTEAAADTEAPPTTRVLRAEKPAKVVQSEPAAPRTVLVRGKNKIARETFERDPVVGFLVIVGGPGLGAFRPIFEGNNTLGRSPQNRIPLDFGDDAISSDAQAYVRYDSNDRSFLFVPNLAKTNVVSVNEKRPTGAVPLLPMDVITLGRTQVAFLPFCGGEFDWSEISET